MNNEESFALGYLLGKKNCANSNDGNSDKDSQDNDCDWYTYDPDWDVFCNAPDPQHNQVILGIRILDPTVQRVFRNGFYASVYLQVTRSIWVDNTTEYHPAYTVDWGDGTITSMSRTEYYGHEEWYQGLMHTYEEAGLYTIVLTLEDNDYEYDVIYSDGSGYIMRGAGVQLNLDTIYTSNNKMFTTVSYTIMYKSPICIFAKVGTMFCITYEPINESTVSYKNRGGLSFSTFGCSHITIKYLQYPMVLKSSDTTYATMLFYGMSSLQYLKFTPLPEITKERLPPLEVFTELFYNNKALEKIEGLDWNKISTEIAPGRLFCFCYSINLPEVMYFKDFSNYTINGAVYKKKTKKISLPNCTHLSSYSLTGAVEIEELELPECVEIDSYGLAGLQNLKKISLPKCKQIGDYAFDGCIKLEEIELSECVELGNNVFNNNYNLRKITLPKITNAPFSITGLYNLRVIEMPMCVSVSGSFASNESLYSFIVSPDCMFENSNSFQGCYSLIPHPNGTIN